MTCMIQLEVLCIYKVISEKCILYYVTESVMRKQNGILLPPYFEISAKLVKKCLSQFKFNNANLS